MIIFFGCNAWPVHRNLVHLILIINFYFKGINYNQTFLCVPEKSKQCFVLTLFSHYVIIFILLKKLIRQKFGCFILFIIESRRVKPECFIAITPGKCTCVTVLLYSSSLLN